MAAGDAGRSGWIAAYADASWSDSDKRGGFGVWIRTDDVRIVLSGPTPEKVRSSLHAEAAAVFAAVWTAREFFADVRGMTVRTDCMAVVNSFMADRCRDPLVQDWTQRATNMAKAAGIQLRVVWIKGHQSRKRGIGQWINGEVDELAGQARLDGQRRIRREAVQPSPPKARG